MTTKKFATNEVLGKKQLTNLKGGIELSSGTIATITSIISTTTTAVTSYVNSLEGGDETDKRAKKPGVI
jgi:hypothetical protein